MTTLTMTMIIAIAGYPRSAVRPIVRPRLTTGAPSSLSGGVRQVLRSAGVRVEVGGRRGRGRQQRPGVGEHDGVIAHMNGPAIRCVSCHARSRRGNRETGWPVPFEMIGAEGDENRGTRPSI
jgi:hypothetical protein